MALQYYQQTITIMKVWFLLQKTEVQHSDVAVEPETEQNLQHLM